MQEKNGNNPEKSGLSLKFCAQCDLNIIYINFAQYNSRPLQIVQVFPKVKTQSKRIEKKDEWRNVKY